MKSYLFLIILFSKLGLCQSSFNIEDYNGIWIAQEFYSSFEKTNNIIKSKNSFEPNAPVGLRINNEEIKNNIINIGFSSLHDHLLRPEVSEYLVNKKDTIPEQGNFKINLTKNNGYNQFRTSEIEMFNDYKSIITFKKNRITIFCPSSKGYKSQTISYIRIIKRFETDYKYPNPLYYYTRNKLLVGNYILKDNLGNIISKNLKIGENGLVTGFKLFNNKYFFYSTDVYCGIPIIDEYIILSDKIKSLFQDESFGFVLKKTNEGIIYLYDTYPREKQKYLKNRKYNSRK